MFAVSILFEFETLKVPQPNNLTPRKVGMERISGIRPGPDTGVFLTFAN